jgi:hypothetical protein
MARPDPLTEYADRLLTDGWCLRSALVRYAQAQPVRATSLHALMRRLDAAIVPSSELRESLTPTVAQFDAFALVMATWAADRSSYLRPDDAVDAVLASTRAEFERLQVPEEQIDQAEWKGMRASEGRRPPKKAAKPEPTPPS